MASDAVDYQIGAVPRENALALPACAGLRSLWQEHVTVLFLGIIQ